jgi:YesN/AraC family two-component response regulator
VFKAENGLDAWSLFIREHIDCVITDIWMPGLKGNDLSRKIRKQSPSTKIALMTGAETEGVTEFLKDGTADYFFRKPFDLQKICSVFITDT